MQYQKCKKDYKEETKTDKVTKEVEATVPLFTDVKNILHSFSSNVFVNINNQEFYKFDGLPAHKSYYSNNFKVAISEYKGVLHCEGYVYEDFPTEIVEAPLLESFFRRIMKDFIRLVGFLLDGKLAVDFSSTSDLLYPDVNIRPRLIRARPIFYMISDNPNAIHGIVDYSLYTRGIALKNDYHQKRMDMLAHIPVEFNYMETLAKTFGIPARQNQFI